MLLCVMNNFLKGLFFVQNVLLALQTLLEEALHGLDATKGFTVDEISPSWSDPTVVKS